MSSDQVGPALRFDASRCDGFGMCSVVYPEGIALDAWGYARVAADPIEDRSSLRRALRAVRCCPAGALSLSGVPGGEPTG